MAMNILAQWLRDNLDIEIECATKYREDKHEMMSSPHNPLVAFTCLLLSETCKDYRKLLWYGVELWALSFKPPKSTRNCIFYTNGIKKPSAHVLKPRYVDIDFSRMIGGKVWCSTAIALMDAYVDVNGFGDGREGVSTLSSYYEKVYETRRLMRVDVSGLENPVTMYDEIYAAVVAGIRVGVMYVYIPSSLSHPSDKSHEKLQEHNQVVLGLVLVFFFVFIFFILTPSKTQECTNDDHSECDWIATNADMDAAGPANPEGYMCILFRAILQSDFTMVLGITGLHNPEDVA